MLPSRPDDKTLLPDGIGRVEFVAMMALIMAMMALSIDTMLPALPDIGHDLRVANPNDRQLIITTFFVGISIGALIFGPLSDHHGRRPILLGSSISLLLSTIVCAMASSFEVMLAARLLCGFFAASARVLVVSIVRDCFRGDSMARIMSFIMSVFIIVPALAPSIGQAVLFFAQWRATFWGLAAFIGAIVVWTGMRLPETLDSQHHVKIRPKDLAATFWSIVTNRGSMGHMIASGLIQSGLVGMLVSIQQVFFDTFEMAWLLPVGFAIMASGMGVGSIFNSRLVEHFGARRMSQSALIVLILISLIHAAIIMAGWENVVTFIVLQCVTSTCFSFSGSNFSAISLEPFSRGAGLASSIQASVTTAMAAMLGGLVGAHFDGTPLPLTLGFLCFGCLSLLVVAWAENWQLFRRPGHAALRTTV